ncbi:TPA: multidrug transporter [Vibrio parahaemolyticus]|uniref:MATE family Na+-driven efflux transporter n=1 Tax=Vibrio parahaemolyticus TaxID=670 RepID=UPI00040361A2|nr:MATE family Na+-driven efflux transporter [Vibrio parahaemolyticus]EJG2371832.1 multidrug transporter [Vibrio parahaemolyticus]MCX8905604.1 multidrug transporter [Vibrio parahaemolyticus]TOD41900.1 multidrug transporter [Vibrio parahaemolyticus]TPA08897.1 multidrug transporter [Vibrio parahaemolyticus]HBC3602924.1 multidrug transporter [Vibrio parahaemolyticus]
MARVDKINVKLWLVLILSSLVPLIYTTTRIHFIGSMPDSWAFSIAAQVAWLNIGYEVINEALLLPLAFILGQVIMTKETFQRRAVLSLGMVILVYAIVTVFVLALTPQLVSAMQQQESLLAQTIKYIRLESIAIFVSSAYLFFNLVLVLHNKQKALYSLLAIQTLLTIICDTLLVSQFPSSLQLGVTGIAITNIVVHTVLVVVSYKLLSLNGFTLDLRTMTFNKAEWFKEWLRIGTRSGLESFVRNTAFVVMILQLMNQLQQAGTFWVANGFIWGWLLLPVLTLGQLVKQDAATNSGLTTHKVNCYLLVTCGIFLIWFISAPQWELFIQNVMGVGNAEQVVNLVYLMVGFYVVFALNNVIDSYFYGIGRTDLMLYQSLAVNILFYGTAFVLYQFGWFVPTLDRVAIMFGLGITFDALLTWGLYVMLRKQQSEQKLAIA